MDRIVNTGEESMKWICFRYVEQFSRVLIDETYFSSIQCIPIEIIIEVITQMKYEIEMYVVVVSFFFSFLVLVLHNLQSE